MARRAHNQTRQTSRTIYYYTVVNRYNDARLTTAEITSMIRELQRVTSSPPAYLPIDNDHVLCGWVDEHQQFPLQARIGITRRFGLPPVERQGLLSPLNLNADEGLSELTHIAFFQNSVVGIEFNFYGPRPFKIAQYLSEQTNQTIKFIPLMNYDAAEKLANMTALTKIELKVKSDAIDNIRQANQSVASLFGNIGDYNGIQTIEINLSTKPRSNEVLDGRIFRSFRALVENLTDWGAVDKLKVKGIDPDSDNSIELDLLSEHIVSKQHMVRVDERSRAIDSESAYRGIIRGYHETANEIRAAIGEP